MDNKTGDDLETDVLKNPEKYLAAISNVFVAFNMLVLIILGMITLWLTKNVMKKILINYLGNSSSLDPKLKAGAGERD